MNNDNIVKIVNEVSGELKDITVNYLNDLNWYIEQTNLDHKTFLLVKNLKELSNNLYNAVRDLHEYKENQYDELQEDE